MKAWLKGSGGLRSALRSAGRVDVGGGAARVADFAIRRAVLVVAVVVSLCLAAFVLALRLDPSAATSTLVDRDNSTFKATEEFHRQFGEEPIVVLIRGRLTSFLLTPDLATITGLEGCLSGKLPRGKRPATVPRKALPRQCAEFARLKPIQVVYGPGTFISESARQITAQIESQRGQKSAEAEAAARAAQQVAAAEGKSEAEQQRLALQARRLVFAQFARGALGLALRYGLTSLPALNNPEFVLRLVFEPSLGYSTPKTRFSYLFPNANSALIQARLRPGLSGAERRRAIELVRETVADRRFHLDHGRYSVSGVPTVTEGVASSVSGALRKLLIVAVIVMAITLLVVFRSRLRLLPLMVALGAAALTFGVMSVVGASLTIASIAVLPVLVGLAVDYAIQFQARFNEARDEPAPSGAEGEAERRRSAPEAARVAASGGAPVIAVAGLATAAGFLAMLLSPVPMVRSFGALLVLGIVLAFALTLTAGFAVLGRDPRLLPGAPLLRLRRAGPVVGRRARRGAGDALHQIPRPTPPAREAGTGRGARGVLARWSSRVGGRGVLARWSSRVAPGPRGVVTFARRTPARLLKLAIERPRRVLAVAIVLAAAGWGVGSQTEVVSDIQRLVPGNLREIRDVETLQNETGVSGDINVVVSAPNLTTPRVLSWMASYQKRVLGRHGFSTGRTCRQAKLCPALSLTNLFGSGALESPRQIRTLLNALPPYFSRSVISRDRHTADMSFGIRSMPLDEQKSLVDDMRAQLDPPRGVSAELAGLPVLAADANADLESSRWLLTLVGLAAVFLVLIAVYRRTEAAIVPLIPIALATGWSALVLFSLGVPLNPMSATLGVLVIAISTEFSVILSARYRQERTAGLAPALALERTYNRTGAAVRASGATAIAGFAALTASDVPMLRDFGLVTVVDLTVALIGVMLVLPAAVMWAEQRGTLAFALRPPASARRLRALRRRGEAQRP